MTIHEIAAANKEAGRFFFSQDTLRAFGQTLESFRVVTVGEKIYVWAGQRGAPRGFDVTLAEFNRETGVMNPIGAVTTHAKLDAWLDAHS